MQKYNIKRILFYISLIPYIHVVAMCLYSAIFGYTYYSTRYSIELGHNIDYPITYYGFEAAGERFMDIWDTDILCILLILVSYQIYYFLTYKNIRNENGYTIIEDEDLEEIRDNDEQKNDIKETKVKEKKKSNIKKKLYVISLGCWGVYFLLGIKEAFSIHPYLEITFDISQFKSALALNLLIFSLIPVLPITAIYITIYSWIQNKPKFRGIIAELLLLLFIIYLYLPILGYESSAFILTAAIIYIISYLIVKIKKKREKTLDEVSKNIKLTKLEIFYCLSISFLIMGGISFCFGYNEIILNLLISMLFIDLIVFLVNKFKNKK